MADRRACTAARHEAGRTESTDRIADQEPSPMSSPPGQTDPLPLTKERCPSRARPQTSLDPRLRPFAHALADLLLADLLKYPPGTS